MSYQNKTDLYDKLWNDYKSHKGDIENCFIYKHCKSKKDDRADNISHSKEALYEYKGEQKRDKYTLLRGAYLAMKNNVISEAEYKDIFMELTEKEKGVKAFVALLDTNLQAAQSGFEFKLLKGSIGDLFNNEGYRESTKGRQPDKGRKKSDGYIDNLELACLFSAYDNRPSETASGEVVNAAAEITDEYIEKCRALYNAALESKGEGKNDVFIPLLFDSSSGAGIYIIGKSYISNSEKANCAVFILRFWCCDGYNAGDDDSKTSVMPIGLDDFEDDDDVPMIQVGWEGEEMPLMMRALECVGINDAFKRFSRERISDVYFEDYAGNNTAVPAEDVDDCFIRLLRSSEERKNWQAEIMELEKQKEIMLTGRYKAAEEANRAL